jgi:hypothetical protein
MKSYTGSKTPHRLRRVAVAALALILTGCASTSFVSTWKNPEATPLGRAGGQVVVACVVTDDVSVRHPAEDALAAELTLRGAKGVPSYTILSSGMKDEALSKAAFEKIGAVAVVAMRPMKVEQEVSVIPEVYHQPSYSGYWGGYYGYGWNRPYSATAVQVDTVVTVETLFYSLKQNRLVWSGRSRTTNPSKVDSLVHELVKEASREMNKAGVFSYDAQ